MYQLSKEFFIKKSILKDVRIPILLFLLLLFSSPVFSQKGRDFWIAPPTVSQLNIPISLHITTYGSSALVTVYQPSGIGLVDSRTIAANSTDKIPLVINAADLPKYSSAPNAKSFNGLHIQSNADISVYYECSAPSNFAGLSLKAEKALGKTFYVPFQNSYPTGNSGWASAAISSVDIVATQNSTSVSWSGSKSGSITLNEGEVYSITPSNQTAAAHLFPLMITSDKNIAVSIKDDLLNYGFGYDLAADQLVPVDYLGKEYCVTRGTMAAESLYVIPVDAGLTNITYHTTGSGTLPALSYNNIPQGTAIKIPLDANPIYANQPHTVIGTGKLIVLHLGGRLEEAGLAVIPKLDCGNGATEVTYVRTATGIHAQEGVYVSLVYKNTTVPFQFKVNGVDVTPSPSAGPISAPKIVGYTQVQYRFTTAQLPLNGVLQVSHTTTTFQMGVMNFTGPGCEYDYFSDFSLTKPTACLEPIPVLCSHKILTQSIDARCSKGETNTTYTLYEVNMDPQFPVPPIIKTLGTKSEGAANSILHFNDFKNTAGVTELPEVGKCYRIKLEVFRNCPGQPVTSDEANIYFCMKQSPQNFSLQSPSICHGDCAIIGGGTPEAGVTYSWEDLLSNSMTRSVCPTITTNYALVGTKDGCSTRSPLTVVVSPPKQDIISTVNWCTLEPVLETITCDPGLTFMDDGTTTTTSNGLRRVEVRGRCVDANGCTIKNYIKNYQEINDGIVPEMAFDYGHFCIGNNHDLFDISTYSNPGASTRKWFVNGVLASTANPFVYNPRTPGTVTLDLIVKQNGCEARKTVVRNVVYCGACVRKFDDKFCDGIMDVPATGLAGFTFLLTGPENRTLISGTDGMLCFNLLRPGNYKLCEVARPGWKQTFPKNSSCINFTINTYGGIAGPFNFLNCKKTTLFPNWPPFGFSAPIIGNITNSIGMITVGRTVEPDDEIHAFEFFVQYDPFLITPTGNFNKIGTLSENAVVTMTTVQPGLVKVTAESDTIMDGDTVIWIELEYETGTATGITDINVSIDTVNTDTTGIPDQFITTGRILISQGGNSALSSEGINAAIVKEEELNCFPNPFSESSEIHFHIQKEQRIVLSIFDVNGKLIETLLNGKMPVGRHAYDYYAAGLNAGIYFVVLETESGIFKNKLIITGR